MSRLEPMTFERMDLGRLSYAAAYEEQVRQHDRVFGWRESPPIANAAPAGVFLMVEHLPPVITVSRRPGVRDHLIASEAMLASAGVELAETDRGGDITYHGPGQLVVYPIVDLNRLKLGLHAYMRAMEEAVIRTCAGFGVRARRDAGATGVWVDPCDGEGQAAKVCAMGVRVRRWVSMHGLAINVTTNLAHFQLIVPCGLAGRPVTSLQRLLGSSCPPMEQVKERLCDQLAESLVEVADSRVQDA